MHSAGSSQSRFGAIIGIPINYTYKSVNDVDTANIRVKYYLVSLFYSTPTTLKHFKSDFLKLSDFQIEVYLRKLNLLSFPSLFSEEIFLRGAARHCPKIHFIYNT